MGVRHLQDESWHTERVHRAEGDERRDKRKCAYYAKKNNFCVRFQEKCRGSAHCGEYMVRIEEEEKNFANLNTVAKQDFGKIPSLSEQVAEQLYSIGTRVKHDKWGRGIVTGHEASSETIRIVVMLDSGSKIKFALSQIVKDESLIPE